MIYIDTSVMFRPKVAPPPAACVILTQNLSLLVENLVNLIEDKCFSLFWHQRPRNPPRLLASAGGFHRAVTRTPDWLFQVWKLFTVTNCSTNKKKTQFSLGLVEKYVPFLKNSAPVKTRRTSRARDAGFRASLFSCPGPLSCLGSAVGRARTLPSNLYCPEERN